jgi:hypothetical protein
MNARVNAVKTHCLRGHPLSGDNLYVSMSRGVAMRQCRRCRQVRRPKTIAAIDERALARLRDALADGDATMAELAGRFGIGVNTVARVARAAS